MAPVNDHQFDQIVEEAIAGLPDWVHAALDNIVIVVDDYPTREQDPHGEGLLGLYEGISLAERGMDYFGVMPDTITIFRRPHLALGLGRHALADEIRTTVVHEVAHHLGIDDERLHELGWG